MYSCKTVKPINFTQCYNTVRISGQPIATKEFGY